MVEGGIPTSPQGGGRLTAQHSGGLPTWNRNDTAAVTSATSKGNIVALHSLLAYTCYLSIMLHARLAEQFPKFRSEKERRRAAAVTYTATASRFDQNVFEQHITHRKKSQKRTLRAGNEENTGGIPYVRTL